MLEKNPVNSRGKSGEIICGAGHGPGEAQVAESPSRELLILAETPPSHGRATRRDSANPGLSNRLYSPLRTSLCTHSSTCPVHTHYSIRTVFSPLRLPALYPIPLRQCQPHCPRYGVMTPSSGFLVVPVARSSAGTWTAVGLIVEPPRYRRIIVGCSSPCRSTSA